MIAATIRNARVCLRVLNQLATAAPAYAALGFLRLYFARWDGQTDERKRIVAWFRSRAKSLRPSGDVYSGGSTIDREFADLLDREATSIERMEHWK